MRGVCYADNFSTKYQLSNLTVTLLFPEIFMTALSLKAFRHQAILVTITGMLVTIIIGCGPKWQLAPLEPAAPSFEADSGMVVAAHPLAAEAGVSVLQDGGNAVDAAIATLFVLNVVEPNASGLGGGGFALVRMADGDAKVVDYRDRAPRSVDTAFYYNPADSLKHMRHGGTSVCVPGAASGWAELYDGWATMPLERLTRDAIRLAEEGFPINPGLARMIAENLALLNKDSLLAGTFLRDGNPCIAGDTLRQPALAKTFRDLTAKGLRSFYRGPIAESVVESIRADSGTMTLDDLEFYRAEVVEPIHGLFQYYDLLTVPPPSMGGSALIETLNLVQETDATKTGIGTPETLHLVSQCIQQAYADAEARIGDPHLVKTNWQEMLTPAFAAKAKAGISLEAKPAPRQAVPPSPSDHGNTTHLVVADYWGNVVSITQSINYFFGAGVMAGNTGILLNNQMADFSSMPDTLNIIRPKARPRSNMAPLIILTNDLPFLIVGTPGGPRITSTVAQIVLNVLVGRMDLNAAVDYPRIFPVGEHLVLESRFPKPTVKYLYNKGYKLHLAGPYNLYFGGAHAIAISRKTGMMMGAADKRRSGAARGF